MIRPLSRTCLLVATFAFALIPLAHARARSQSGSTKSILVTVLDKRGEPIPNLTAADFSVKEDGNTRQVTGATPATDPLYIALLVDTSQPPPGTIPPTQSLRVGLSDFVKIIEAASPKSAISLTEFGGAAVTTVPLSSDTAPLTQHIDHLYPGQQAGAVMLEALVSAGDSLAHAPSPRRDIVSVTLGTPETSSLSANDVIRSVYASGASVWTVEIEAVGTTSSGAVSSMGGDNTPARNVVVKTLTGASGGQELTAMSSSALRSLLTQVANALTSQYVVTYIRPDGAFVHKIEPNAKGAGKVLMSQLVR
jgi:Ca-activated chloride channel homolog